MRHWVVYRMPDDGYQCGGWWVAELIGDPMFTVMRPTREELMADLPRSSEWHESQYKNFFTPERAEIIALGQPATEVERE